MKISPRLVGKVPDTITKPATYKRRTVTGAVCLVLLAFMTFGASLMPAPYVVQSPGPTLNVLGDYEGKDVVQVEGHEGEKPGGELRMTTVAVQGAPGNSVYLSSVFLAWFDSSRAILPVEALYPDTAEAADTKLMNAVEMNGSQQEAIATALTEQGIEYSKNVMIAGIRDNAAAANVLKAGDVVVSVNGESYATVAENAQAIGRTTEGSDVTIVVKRDGTEKSFTITPKREGTKALLGIVLTPGFEFPVDVNFAVEGIGGPSAGLIFSLAILDEMTPGDLTGGKAIAGTGTIDEEGHVGPIGGIRQKLMAAKADGAQFFLAPADNCTEVAGHIPDGLQVVRVATFDEALTAVHQIANTGKTDGLPRCE